MHEDTIIYHDIMSDHHIWSVNMTDMEIGRKETDCYRKKKNPTNYLLILKRAKGIVPEIENVWFNLE